MSDEEGSKSNGHDSLKEECDEEPCQEVIVKPLEDGEEEAAEKKPQNKKISATMETNDRLTPQNCVVQPLLTGTLETVNKVTGYEAKLLRK